MSLPGLQAFIDDGYDEGTSAFSYFNPFRNHLYAAGDAILANNWAQAKTELYGAGNDFALIGRYLLQDDLFNKGLRRQWRDAFNLINDNWPTSQEITMDAILTEMLSATFEQLTSFMGITQAYKVAVWDAPFNEEYYAALARGFKTWGV